MGRRLEHRIRLIFVIKAVLLMMMLLLFPSCDELGEDDTFTPNHTIRFCNQTTGLGGCPIQITYFGLHEEATNDGIGWYKFVSNPVYSCTNSNDFKEIEIEIPETGSYDLVFKESKSAETEIYWEDIALEEDGITDVYLYHTTNGGGFYYGSAASIDATGSTLVCD